MVWLETPTARALLLGSLVMATASVSLCMFISVLVVVELTLPGVDNGDTVVDDHVTTLDGAALDQREVGLALLESNGPVDQVEVQVAQLELSKAGIQGSLDDLRAVLAVPQLGGDEEVLTLEAGNILVGALDAVRNLTLVLVDGSQVQVTVAGLQGLVDGLADLARGRLPGTESQLAVMRVSN